jgi:malonyl CoA-acyl carrier protein transacylase
LGLLAFCQSIGVQPIATVGHSSGEIAAAYAAGILSLRDAIIIAYYRGVFMSAASANKPGAMAAITMTPDACVEMLKSYDGRVDLACINSPSSCTISGDAECIDEIVAKFKEEGIFCRKLRVDTAFHSHHMLPLAIPYREALDNASVAPATSVPEDAAVMYSSVHGRAVAPAEVTPEYWAQNMTQTVRFRDAISVLARNEAGLDTVLEIGPHPALKGPALESISEAVGDAHAPSYFGTLSRGTDDVVALFSTVGSMISARVPLTLDKCGALGLSHTTNQVLTDYPLYPWEHNTIHWAESRVSRAHRFRKHRRDMLLGARVSHDTPLSMCWRNILRANEVDWLKQRRADGKGILIASLFCQIIIRAAHKLASDRSIVAPTVKLTGLKFHMANARGFDGDADIETQLMFTPLSLVDGFSFRLLISNTALDDQWAVALEGCLSLIPSNIPHVNGGLATTQNAGSLPDATLNDQLACPDTIVLHSAAPDRVTGEITYDFNFDSYESSDLHTFDWILSLTHRQPGMAFAGREYAIASIDEILVAPTTYDTELTFESRITSIAAGRAVTSLTVIAAGNSSLVIKGATSVVVHDGQTALPYHSLFLAPVWLSDISELQPQDGLQMNVQQLIAQVTHKWPLCDIAISTKSAEIQSLIMSHLPGILAHQRPKFRTLTTTLTQDQFTSERVTYTESLTGETFRLLFVDADDFDTVHVQRVVPGGLICVLHATDANEFAMDDSAERLCSLLIDPNTSALLLRRKLSEESETLQTNPPLLVAATRECVDISDVVFLQEAAEKHVPGESVELVVFDSGKGSILCTMDAGSWISNLQVLLADAKTLLWIAIDDGDYPYWGAASALVRAVVAEQPSLSAATLLVKETITDDLFHSVVVPLLASIRAGLSETEMRLQDGQLQVLRYLPDDSLNALTGDGPVCRERSPLDSCNHRVSHSKPGEMVLQPIRHVPLPDSSRDDLLEIEVHSSVLDMVDLHETFSDEVVTTEPGHFFSGTAISDGRQYIGYHVGCHARRLLVPREHVYEFAESSNLKGVLISFAANAISYAVMHASRARSEDTVRVSFQNNLTNSLKRVARTFGCDITEDESSSVDLDYAYSHETGFTLNGKLLDIRSALRKASPGFAKILQDGSDDLCDLVEYQISELTEALSHSKRTGDSVVLDHLSNATSLQEFHHTDAPRIFRDDAFYVLVGGFGGLGVCVMDWMFQKGGRHFAVLSRSGASSDAAKAIVHNITERGGSLLSIKVDAGNKAAVHSAIAKLRAVRPIGGCLNMALILDSSPFISMTASQWNIGMRHKVDTTIALHEATLEDDLDFFIMFSSVAAIVGNRGQAAYAAGNAFLNSMAEYRKTLGRPGVSIALAAMKDVGVLVDDPETRRSLERSGLSLLETKDLLHIIEAAVHESRHQQRQVLVTGLSMFSRSGSAAEIETAESQVFWKSFPEFSHLFGHSAARATDSVSASLVHELSNMDKQDAQVLLCSKFIEFLSHILGYPSNQFDTSRGIAAYGADSLVAVSCRFWFHQRIDLNVTVFEIIGARSIDAMIAKFVERVQAETQTSTPAHGIEPKKHSDGEITQRPLSHSQSRLWFLHKFLPDKTMYNLLLTCFIEGEVNEAAFRQAWATLVMRHEALRTRIVSHGTDWAQIPAESSTFTLDVVHCASEDFEQQNTSLTTKARGHIFDPANGILVCTWLLVSPAGSRFYMASHHLAWDRASAGTVFNELSAIYKNIIHRRHPEEGLEVAPWQFIDYTLWQNQLLETLEYTDPHNTYWRSQLKGIPDAVSLLPFAKVTGRPPIKKAGTNSTQQVLSPAEAKGLKDFCATQSVTPFMLATFVIGCLVHCLTGDEDIVVGIADGDRGHTAFDRMIGFTVNMLPLRMGFSSDRSCRSSLEELRNTCLGAYEHRAVPFDYLLQILDTPRQTSHSPVFQIVVNYQTQGAFPKADFEDFRFFDFEHYNARTETDIYLEIEERSDGALELKFDLDAALYGSEAASQFARLYTRLMKQVMQNADFVPKEIALASPEDVKFASEVLQPALPEIMPGARQQPFTALFKHWSLSRSEKAAIVDDNVSINYRELDSLTGCLARSLRLQYAGPQECVGLACEPSASMAVALWGIVRARCIVVPIDPDFPVDRIRSIIEDTGLSTVVISDAPKVLKQKLISAGIPHIVEFQDLIKTTSEKEDVLLDTTQPSDKFCALFTSGSSGRSVLFTFTFSVTCG